MISLNDIDTLVSPFNKNGGCLYVSTLYKTKRLISRVYNGKNKRNTIIDKNGPLFVSVHPPLIFHILILSPDFWVKEFPPISDS